MRYSEYPDGKTFAKLLHIKNGDSVEKTSSLLGTPTIHTDMIELMRGFIAEGRDKYPEGIEAGDVFLEFCCVQPGAVWLQARNGKLVNYDAENFRHLLDYK
jgi:hypothetical protein